MITEDYVSLEIAKLLKENHFNEETDYIYYYYDSDDDYCFEKLLPGDKFIEDKMIHCPTLQMALKWLREEHKIFITIGLCTYPILNKCTWIPQVETLNDCYPNVSKEYDTYEGACEAAIKYCLENLI